MLCRSRLSAFGVVHRRLGLRHASSVSKKSLEVPPVVTVHPLAKELQALGRPTGRASRKIGIADAINSHKNKTYLRPQIVSPGLCDDVLKYMGHTLEQYKGCDIIDLNPGAGLWSQKLHEFLRPRTHVLVDVSEGFDPFIRRLLDTPGSTYKHFKANITKHDDLDRLIDSGLLPYQKRVQCGDAGAHELNKSLLVTGMLLWEPRLPGHGFDSMTRQLLAQWSTRAWTHQGFHAFGPVRSLFWGASDDMKGVIPQTAKTLSKYSMFLDFVSKRVEVVTTPRRAGTSGREPQYEIESLLRAMRSGREKGFVLPLHRRQIFHDFAEEIEQMTGGSGELSAGAMFDYLIDKTKSGSSTSGIVADSIIDLVATIKHAEENPAEYVSVKPKRYSTLIQNTKSRELAVKKASVKLQKSIKEKIEKVVSIAKDMHNLEIKALGMEDGPSKDALLATIAEKSEEIQHQVETKIPKTQQASVSTQIDDRLALDSPVERLQWDSRPYEPLAMQLDEVWPNVPVSLVDFTPRPPLDNSDPDWAEWLIDFAHGLLLTPSSSVIQALETMQPGASQIVDQAPSLRDPTKGGRLNLHHLRCRMLTVDMVNELCRAYRDWPFRSKEANHSKFFRLRMGRSRAS